MFTGTGTALVTPFRTDGSLDEAALRRLVRRQIDAGVEFLVPCGTTGESPTLTHEEHLRVVEITIELAKGKVPVLAGAGGHNTAEVTGLAHELAALGGRGVISVVSNEIPAEMSQLTRLALRGDFGGARAIHRRYHPLMEINFVESNPMPVKAAMAEMGLLEPVWRLPLVAPKAENQARIRAVLESLGLAKRAHAAFAN